MGYLDTKNRENVDKIIEETLSSYFGKRVIVTSEYCKGCFILNPRLNTAIYEKPSLQIRKAVQVGHAIHKNFVLNCIARLYNRFGFSRHSLFGCKYIVFDEIPKEAQNIIIMPGNLKIKVFDYCRGKITNLLKANFDKSSLNRELEVRSSKTLKPYVLPLKFLDKDVYEEDLIIGCSLDRLDYRKYPGIEEDLVKIILDYQQDRRAAVSTDIYFKEIKNKINVGLNCLKCDAKERFSISQFTSGLETYAGTYVTISASHGDLQNGNIFISNDNHIWILDWETYGVRSIGYDVLTYYYKFRYRKDYISRINAFMEDVNWGKISGIFWNRTIEKGQVLAVYLVEDVLWQVEECLSTAEKRPSTGLLKYADPNFQRVVLDILEKK